MSNHPLKLMCYSWNLCVWKYFLSGSGQVLRQFIGVGYGGPEQVQAPSEQSWKCCSHQFCKVSNIRLSDYFLMQKRFRIQFSFRKGWTIWYGLSHHALLSLSTSYFWIVLWNLYLIVLSSLTAEIRLPVFSVNWGSLVRKKFTKHTGCLKKKGDLFYDQYLHQIKHKSTGYTFDVKGGIHSFAWSTKTYLYHIRQPRYKKKKWVSDIKNLK